MGADTYDVAVVGAGPGGSAAAIVLARAGLHVALIDRQTFPRTKPCGDLIGCGGIALSHRLGMDGNALAPYQPLHGAVIVAPDTRPLVLRAGKDSRDDARVIPRHIFDTALVRTAERAGATVVHLHVRNLLHEQGHVVGVCGGDARTATTIHARAVIGADGYGSRIAREVRGDETTRAGQVGVALRAYATGFSLPRAWEGCLVFAYDAQTAPGYGWLMPLPDGGAKSVSAPSRQRLARPIPRISAISSTASSPARRGWQAQRLRAICRPARGPSHLHPGAPHSSAMVYCSSGKRRRSSAR